MIGLATSMTACSTTGGIRHYDAFDIENLGAQEPAVLQVPWEVKVGAVNGKDRYYPLLAPITNPYRGAQIRLLPGTHTLELTYHYPGYHTSYESAVVKYNFLAGQHYQLEALITTVNNLIQVDYRIEPSDIPGE